MTTHDHASARPRRADFDPETVGAERRRFLQRAGLGGAALFLAACGGQGVAGDALAPSSQANGDGTVTLNFASDLGVLNYAYALEQLEAAFYQRVVDAPQFSTIYAGNVQRVLRDLRDHEVVHREFYAAALGANAIGALEVDFSSVDFGDPDVVLGLAQTFEDLGVGAYNGAGKYLSNPTFLTLAGKIVSVEARHASAIRSILQPRTGNFAPSAFDPALAPSAVLAAADPFIVTPVTVINA